jgi:hypothetical protein
LDFLTSVPAPQETRSITVMPFDSLTNDYSLKGGIKDDRRYYIYRL